MIKYMLQLLKAFLMILRMLNPLRFTQFSNEIEDLNEQDPPMIYPDQGEEDLQ
jgi:hypothetical protein